MTCGLLRYLVREFLVCLEALVSPGLTSTTVCHRALVTMQQRHWFTATLADYCGYLPISLACRCILGTTLTGFPGSWEQATENTQVLHWRLRTTRTRYIM